MTDRIVIYRLIGNSLPPRHSAEHTAEALRFILANEPALPQAEKRWILNRIADPEAEAACIGLLEDARITYHRIPFDPERYARAFLDASGMPAVLNPFAAKENYQTSFAEKGWAEEWMLRHKSFAAINLNATRNFAIEQGKSRARWILPLDGSCFFTAAAWEDVRRGLTAATKEKYAIIPLVRVADNAGFLDAGFVPSAFHEPQIAFRNDAPDRFDERLRYGSLNKSELLVRLGVPGEWHNWRRPPWERDERLKAREPGNFIQCGWVARLAAGAADAVEVRESSRWEARFEGLWRFTKRLDKDIVEREYRRGGACCYRLEGEDAAGGPAPDMARLAACADGLCGQPLVTILDKTGLPPSGDKQDYFSPAPYDPGSAEQLVLKEGGRRQDAAPESAEPGADDRTALEACLRSFVVLSLAGMATGNDRYVKRAARIIDAWFADPKTRMNPHLKYAHWLPHSPESANFSGVLDFRDIWVVPGLLNALAKRALIAEDTYLAAKSWFAELLEYLLKSNQGKTAYSQPNNVGTWTHLILAAAAAFTDHLAGAADLLNAAPLRLVAQLGPLGMPHQELRRSRPLHYALFNLSAWTALATLGRSLGVDLWRYRGANGQSICSMAAFLSGNKRLFDEYAQAPDLYDSWIDGFVSIAPEHAQDRGSLDFSSPKPEPAWRDESGPGFPPL